MKHLILIESNTKNWPDADLQIPSVNGVESGIPESCAQHQREINTITRRAQAVGSNINTESIRIQNRLLRATGGRNNLFGLLSHFQDLATEQLNLISSHAYLLNTITNTQNSEPAPTHLNHAHTSPSDFEARPPHLLDDVKTFLAKSHPDSDNSVDLVTSGNRCFIIYTLQHIGAIIFEIESSDKFESTAALLEPAIEQLGYSCRLLTRVAALDHWLEQNRKQEQAHEEQANQDPLTKLPNRRAFRYNLYQEIANTQRYNHFGAVLFIDLDYFKNINDSLGHSVGDMLLTKVSERLKGNARTGDEVYRLGGDEFVLLLRNAGNSGESAVNTTQAVANRVISSMASPMEVGDFSLHITPSIGITIFPGESIEENDGESILKHADTAMYMAKSEGRNTFAFYDPEMQVTASKRLIIADYLRKAIANNELRLEYQPIYNTNEELIAAESLLRWQSSALGNVSPEDFIHIAEESNLILDVSNWVMGTACAYVKKIKAHASRHKTFRYITINISPRQFKQHDFTESLLDIIRQNGIDADDIRLEFTENILIDNIDDAIKKMEELLDANIRFILDDFGTGYSSLSYLHRLPIRTIKIDKSFVTGFNNKSYANKAIVDAIIAMADRMELNCVIEGIETEDDAKYFINKGIYAMQGYYYNRPMREDDFTGLLASGPAD